MVERAGRWWKEQGWGGGGKSRKVRERAEGYKESREVAEREQDGWWRKKGGDGKRAESWWREQGCGGESRKVLQRAWRWWRAGRWRAIMRFTPARLPPTSPWRPATLSEAPVSRR